MTLRIAECRKHHHAVRHRRENRAETVLAIEVFDRPGDGAVDGTLARRLRKERLSHTQDAIDAAEEPEPRRILLRRLRRWADALWRRQEKPSMRMPFALRARGFFTISTSNGTMTVRLQYEILSRWNGNQRGSNTTSTGITGTARHGMNPNSASMMRVNTLARSAPPRARTASRARAYDPRRRNLDHLEREIGLHRRADVKRAVTEQRPAAVIALDTAQ